MFIRNFLEVKIKKSCFLEKNFIIFTCKTNCFHQEGERKSNKKNNSKEICNKSLHGPRLRKNSRKWNALQKIIQEGRYNVNTREEENWKKWSMNMENV